MSVDCNEVVEEGDGVGEDGGFTIKCTRMSRSGERKRYTRRVRGGASTAQGQRDKVACYC